MGNFIGAEWDFIGAEWDFTGAEDQGAMMGAAAGEAAHDQVQPHQGWTDLKAGVTLPSLGKVDQNLKNKPEPSPERHTKG